MIKMKSVFLGLSVCLFLVVFVRGQDPPDPCDVSIGCGGNDVDSE